MISTLAKDLPNDKPADFMIKFMGLFLPRQKS
jgi:hypothetical protein